MADINLIPQTEKQEQVKEKAVKTSTIWTLVFLFLFLGVGGYLLYQTSILKQSISEHDSNISGLRADIERMSDIEVSARNLGKRYHTLSGILETRNHYSILLSELSKRIPSTIELETLGTGRGSTINISGIGVDYIAIAKFISDLSNPEFTLALEGKEGLFSDVSLNSVNLDSQTDKARFFIVVTINEGLLTK